MTNARQMKSEDLGIRAANGLTSEQVLVTSVGLKFSNPLTFDRWQKAGEKIARFVDTSAWCLGDWLIYGELRYSGRYREAIEAVGVDYQTARNYVWVARRFDISRRRDQLSFQHHAEVASLPPADQDFWLDQAEREGWSRNQLRRRLRASRSASNDAGDLVLIPQIKVPMDRIERWRAAAKEAHTKFETWMLRALDGAATDVLDHGAVDSGHAGPVRRVPGQRSGERNAIGR